MSAFDGTTVFARGAENTAFAQYFVGQSYLNMLTTKGVPIGNVTFEPACRNNWHIHHAAKGGGQILLCTGGRGWYQEAGKPARAARRRRCGHPGERQALARRGEGQLVCPPCGRDPGRRDGKRVVRAGQRRGIQSASVSPAHPILPIHRKKRTCCAQVRFFVIRGFYVF